MYKVNEIWVGISPTKQKFQQRLGHKEMSLTKPEYIQVLRSIAQSRSKEFFIEEAKRRLSELLPKPVKPAPKKVEIPVVEGKDGFQKAFNWIAFSVILASCVVYAHHSSVVYTMLIETNFSIEVGSFMGYVFGVMIEVSVFSGSLIYAKAVKNEDTKTRDSIENVLEKFAWGHFVISLIYFQFLAMPKIGGTFGLIAFACAKIAFSAFLSYAPYTIKNLIKL